MRNVIIIAVIIAAGWFGYKLLTKEDCPGGKIFETEAACAASGLGAEVCATGFKQANEKAANFPPIATLEQCHLQYPHCVKHGTVNAFVPAPEKVCLVPGKPGEPIFGRIGAQIAGGH